MYGIPTSLDEAPEASAPARCEHCSSGEYAGCCDRCGEDICSACTSSPCMQTVMCSGCLNPFFGHEIHFNDDESEPYCNACDPAVNCLHCEKEGCEREFYIIWYGDPELPEEGWICGECESDLHGDMVSSRRPRPGRSNHRR